MNANGKQATTERDLGLRLRRLLKKKSLGAVLRDDFQFSSYGTLSRIAEGDFPKRPGVRAKFGLPPMMSVAGCPNCDGVHTRACRPKRIKVERKLKVTMDVVGMFLYANSLKKMEIEQWKL